MHDSVDSVATSRIYGVFLEHILHPFLKQLKCVDSSHEYFCSHINANKDHRSDPKGILSDFKQKTVSWHTTQLPNIIPTCTRSGNNIQDSIMDVQ